MDRRNFLRGLGGVVVGLPFLESLAPRRAIAQAAGPRKRFVVFFECNGVNMARFFPNGAHGAITDEMLRGTALEPLLPYRSKMLVPRGTHMVPMGFGQGTIPTNGCDHKKGVGHKLTAQPLQSTADNYPDGISVDQFIANRINPITDAATMARRPAMTLLVGPQSRGVLGSISYSGAGRPVVGENNPFLVYRDMMRLTGAPMMMNDPLALRRASVLDLVRQEMDDLRRAPLSMADRQKLDMHFAAIRDVEMGMTTTGMVACTLPSTTAGALMMLNPDTIASDAQYRTVGRLHLDVMAIALACGFTNVASIQWGRGSGGPIFRWDGMMHDYNHHKLSHGETTDDPMDPMRMNISGYENMLHDIDRWHATQLAYLCEKLNAYDEGSGRTTLDNSAVVWANELSDGKAHDFRDLPWVVVGSAGGYFRQSQYVKLTARPDSNRLGGWWDSSLDAPHNRLLVSFIRAMGIDETRFGHSSLPAGEFMELRA